jgi:hypothetical protein
MTLLDNTLSAGKKLISTGYDAASTGYNAYGTAQSYASLDAGTGRDDPWKVSVGAGAVEDTLGSYKLQTEKFIPSMKGAEQLPDGSIREVNWKDKVESKEVEGHIDKVGKAAKWADKNVLTPAKGIYEGGKDLIENTGKVGEKLVDGIELIEKPLELGGKLTQKVAKPISTALTSGAAKAVGTAAGIVGGGYAVAQGIKDIAGVGDEVDKASAAMSTAGGAASAAAGGAAAVAALTGTAAANFWNPVGWVAGALAVGGTLLGLSKKW